MNREFYVVCNVCDKVPVKSKPLPTLEEAKQVLRETKEVMKEVIKDPKSSLEYWIMECYNDKVVIHKDIELEWN